MVLLNYKDALTPGLILMAEFRNSRRALAAATKTLESVGKGIDDQNG
jgi:hypothetical protein